MAPRLGNTPEPNDLRLGASMPPLRNQAQMSPGFAATGFVLGQAIDSVKRGAELAICSILLGAAVSLAPDGQAPHYPQPMIPTSREVLPTYYGYWSYREEDDLLSKTTP